MRSAWLWDSWFNMAGSPNLSVCGCIQAFFFLCVCELINMYVCVSHQLNQHSVHLTAVQPTDHYHSLRLCWPPPTPGSLSVQYRWVFPWEPGSPLYLSGVNTSGDFNVSTAPYGEQEGDGHRVTVCDAGFWCSYGINIHCFCITSVPQFKSVLC